MNKPKVAVVGSFRNGKSTLVNCLLDDRVARVGKEGTETTKMVSEYSFGQTQIAEYDGKHHGLAEYLALEEKDFHKKNAKIHLWKPILQNVGIIDTPGFERNETDNSVADDALKKADFLLFVLKNKGISQVECSLLQKAIEHKIPYSIIMNCWIYPGTDKADPHDEDNKKIIADICATDSLINQIKKFPPVQIETGHNIWPCNLAWFWFAADHYDEELDRPKNLASKIADEFNVKCNSISKHDIALKSNFLPIRDFFQKNYSWHLISPGSVQSRVTLEQSIRNWEREITNTIDAAKQIICT